LKTVDLGKFMRD